ncbi:MAG: sodium:solute symporter family protein [Chloroherpetonaceae bacterium]|nr:sodium:solute symporter family protein [Chthonomonadaceae bacterium]MDW8208783.1 sodium:solute symporter family protein [Chloroherpetonaceae bacterium]
MNPAIIVFIYLAIVLYIGIFAFRKGKESGEDFFLANRSLGPYVFLLSLFGTNMTAFAILGSSGLAYRQGIGVLGLMASSSAMVIPLTIFFIGTRLWALGKKHGHMTQVQFLRDRWEAGGIGTFISVLTAAMLVPYIIIGVMGGGQTLEAISTVNGRTWVSYEFGGALVAVVVMSYVFFGGMRGTAWVNTFQTVLFLCFGTLAFILLAQSIGGFGSIMQQLASNPRTASLLARDRMSAEEFFSYMFIPLSAIMFPHISIMCLTAERISHFRKTVIWYPLCIIAIWAPSVYLGVVGAALFPGLGPGESDDIIIRLLTANVGPLLSGILGAGIMACVMASDSQILALSTIFSEDLFAYYGGKERFSDRMQVWAGRLFIVLIALVSYWVALKLKDRAGIFELAIRFAFSGFAALSPIMLAALFWKRSTKWGALAAALWVTGCMGLNWYLQTISDPIAPRPPAPAVRPVVAQRDGTPALARSEPVNGPGATSSRATGAQQNAPAGGARPIKPVQIFPQYGDLFLRGPVNVTVYGFLPVFPMVIGSAVLMIVVSLLTPPPGQATIDKYFPPRRDAQQTGV